jgi:hypothetical protein
MGRVTISRDAEVPDMSLAGSPLAAPFSSSELLARLRVPE